MPPLVESTTTLGSYTSGARAVTKPSGLAIGELLVAHCYSVGGVITPPAGWTQLFSTTVGSYPCTSEMYWRIADSADVAGSNFTFTSGVAFNVFLMRVSNFDATTPFNPTIGSLIGSQGSKTISWSATPTNEGNLILITAVHRRGIGSASGYAVQNSNPATWVEGYDYSAPIGSYDLLGALGYAQRTNISSPGNAYVTIANGGFTGNGVFNAVMINQLPPTGPPLNDTKPVESLTRTTALFRGEIIDKGLENADQVGFVISTATQADPGDTAPGSTSYDSFSSEAGDFNNNAIFTSIFRGLTPGTTYYFRAYGHNSDGYAYGDEESFTTIYLPPVITDITPGGSLLGVVTPITITGTGFRAGATVVIDATPCTTIVLVDENTITCDVPASAVAKASVITVENTDSQASAYPFSYIAESLPPTPPATVTATFEVTGVRYIK